MSEFLEYATKRSMAIPHKPWLRTEENLVAGCNVKLWLRCDLRDGLCFFDCDSDSHSARGMVLVTIIEDCNGFTAAAVLMKLKAMKDKIGEQLATNRKSGWKAVNEIVSNFCEKVVAK